VIWVSRLRRSDTAGDVKCAPARWLPTPFIGCCLTAHAAGLAMLAAHPALWTYVLGGLSAVHATIAVIVPFPRNRLLGANITQLPPAAAARGEIALTFDDGPDPAVTPEVLDLLDASAARATFFCIAENAAAHPALVAEIQRRGHQIENHSDRHSLGFSLFGYRHMARDVDRAQATLTRLTGRAPRFFRAPAGLRSPFLDPILQRRGLAHIAWSRRGFDTMTGRVDRVLARLTRGLAGGEILLLHDSGSRTTPSGRPVVLEVLPQLLADIRRRGLKSVTLSTAFADV
jgi:peptidoglycan-N-acetylglucosamine deacetylase